MLYMLLYYVICSVQCIRIHDILQGMWMWDVDRSTESMSDLHSQLGDMDLHCL